jgi:hypothetical protein
LSYQAISITYSSNVETSREGIAQRRAIGRVALIRELVRDFALNDTAAFAISGEQFVL